MKKLLFAGLAGWVLAAPQVHKPMHVASGPCTTCTVPSPAMVDAAQDTNYLGNSHFPEQLYSDPANANHTTNAEPAVHHSAGVTRAQSVTPLDSNGNPSASGKIGVLLISMSNGGDEWCRGNLTPPCTTGSLQQQAGVDPSVSTKVALIDCGLSGRIIGQWDPSSTANYDTCKSQAITPQGLTEAQVEVIVFKDTECCGGPPNLTASAACTSGTPTSNTFKVCQVVAYTGRIVRFFLTRYPNVKLVFLQERSPGIYATTTQSPEPEAFEHGEAMRYVINAQIQQVAGNGTDIAAGNMDYTSGAAPWVGWATYWWAQGTVPCVNCEIANTTWPAEDFDGGHSIASVARSGGVVNVTLSSSSSYAANNPVTIGGVTDTSYNGVFTVLSSPAPTATTFSYSQSGANSSSTGGWAVSKDTAIIGSNGDGTHPTNANGVPNAGNSFMHFFKNSGLTKCWFLASAPACS